MLLISHVYQNVGFRQFLFMFIVIIMTVSFASGSPLQRSGPKLSTNKLTGSSSVTKGNADWDFLILTQQWPQTFCTFSGDNNDSCEVPSAVHEWTIHGLWPSFNNRSHEGPFYCNNSWKFDFSKIKDLESKMLVQWPNLLTAKSEVSLWTHEWEKHGTCSASLPVLNSEHNYFGNTLALATTYNLTKLLQSQGIVPSPDKQYQFDNVVNALNTVLKGTPQLECYSPLENPQVFYIAEVRMCMDKVFKIIDCPVSSMEYKDVQKRLKENKGKLLQTEYQPCSASKPLMIPVIQHKL